ncbi:hypothetical protein E2C01_072377 [Portunus trituberculatus]|uniref:Uncharacterized protein n=1 Tax=Portunus trituberculatus TaxID=210409 RepID=A0A5B7IAK1_PORTR|nr:hypothetical protein [Portunus trituberculatus]
MTRQTQPETSSRLQEASGTFSPYLVVIRGRQKKCWCHILIKEKRLCVDCVGCCFY